MDIHDLMMYQDILENQSTGRLSSDDESVFIRGPLKPSVLPPKSSRAAFSRNSWAAACTDCFSDVSHFLFLWVLLSVYLILGPSPLLIFLMLFRCSANSNIYFKKIWDHKGKKNANDKKSDWRLTGGKVRQWMLNETGCSLVI